jgi:hypothetical protein
MVFFSLPLNRVFGRGKQVLTVKRECFCESLCVSDNLSIHDYGLVLIEQWVLFLGETRFKMTA